MSAEMMPCLISVSLVAMLRATYLYHVGEVELRGAASYSHLAKLGISRSDARDTAMRYNAFTIIFPSVAGTVMFVTFFVKETLLHMEGVALSKCLTERAIGSWGGLRDAAISLGVDHAAFGVGIFVSTRLAGRSMFQRYMSVPPARQAPMIHGVKLGSPSQIGSDCLSI